MKALIIQVQDASLKKKKNIKRFPACDCYHHGSLI